MSTASKQLPTLAELHHDIKEAFKNDQLNLLLNQPPHDKWLKKHPIIKVKDSNGNNVPLVYLPIDKIHFMLTRIFGFWELEIKSIQVAFNSIVAVVRLWVKDPVSGELRFHDGTGACPVQTDKGESAANLSAIKSGAIQMAAPAAVSYAMKDAAENFGKLFGRDLNKTTLAFSAAYWGNESTPPEPPVAKPAPQQTTSTIQTEEEDFL